jgi:hypothetical protein
VGCIASLAIECNQGILQRGMDIKNPGQIGEVEQVQDASIRSSQFQSASTGPRPHVHNYQLAEAGAVNNVQSTELDYQLPRVRKKLRYFLRERCGFVAIGKTALAIQNGDIIDCSGLQS